MKFTKKQKHLIILVLIFLLGFLAVLTQLSGGSSVGVLKKALQPYVVTVHASEEDGVGTVNTDDPYPIIFAKLPEGELVTEYDDRTKQEVLSKLRVLIDQLLELTSSEEYLQGLDEQIQQLERRMIELHTYTIKDNNAVATHKARIGGIANHMDDEAVEHSTLVPITIFGDSLVAGSQSNFKAVFPKSNVIGVGSMQIGPEGLSRFSELLQEDLVNPVVVVVLGTNRGLSHAEMDQFVSLAGDRHVFFVNTISHVGHRESVAQIIKEVAHKYDNVYEIDFLTYAGDNASSYLSSDNIHHSGTGSQAMVGLIAQQVYREFYPRLR